MQLEGIPTSIGYDEVVKTECSFSPLMYKKIRISSDNTKEVGDLLVKTKKYIKGNEPGSQWYMKKSNRHLIRTKALQDFSYIVYPKGDAIIPLNPKVFTGMKLQKGDILLSKDSNVGETAIIIENSDVYDYSGGIVKLNLKEEYDPYYVFACLKHPTFKEQLLALCPKGATIKHAGERWMNCRIAFPQQKDSDQVIKFISTATRLIAECENMVAKKSSLIIDIIDKELGYTGETAQYEYPNYLEIKKEGRLDAAIFGEEYKKKISFVLNYKGGFCTPKEYGFNVIPGPSLEIKLLKTRIDSDEYIPGFYMLLLPTNISEYGTINKVQYLGTKKKLPELKRGDVLFGEAGFHKGRSTVLVDEIDNCTTNAHGLYARSEKVDIKKSCYFRCIFDWYRNKHLIDLMAVGGSGGHFSPDYFDYIRIPKFPKSIVDKLTSEYLSEDKMDSLNTLNAINAVDLSKLGIYQLDCISKNLKNEVDNMISKIICGEKVVLKMDDK